MKFILDFVFLLSGLLVASVMVSCVEQFAVAKVHFGHIRSFAKTFGCARSLASVAKKLFKGMLVPGNKVGFLFLLAPFLALSIALSAWSVLPVWTNIALIDIGMPVMYIMAIYGLRAYGAIFAGWAVNSCYSFFGVVDYLGRLAASRIPTLICIIGVSAMAESFSLSAIVEAQKNCWFCVSLFPLFVVFGINGFIDYGSYSLDSFKNGPRSVCDYDVGYFGLPAAIFNASKRFNMLFDCSFAVVMFCGGWLPIFGFLGFIPGVVWFVLKTAILVLVLIVVKVRSPWSTTEQLMIVNWERLIPVSLLCLMLILLSKAL